MRRAATRLLLGRLGGPSAALPGAVEEAGAAVRVTTSSAVAAERSGLHGPAAAAAAAASDGGEAGPSTPDRVAKVIAHSFHRAPRETATALMRELSELDRIHLVLALQRHTAKAKLQQQETNYVDDLMKQVKHASHAQHGKLTRHQIHNAVIYQRMLQKFAAVSDQPPSWRQLAAVGFASGLPFVVFGILDNGIMLVAGEQIDHLFGAKMGLTVLASAGLGNMVADVVGVSATHTVQENIKRIYNPPRLSLLQQQSGAYKAATFLGAAVGVAIGCLLGMTPLLVMEPGFFVHGSAEQAAEAAAAVADAVAGAAAAAPADAATAAAGAAGTALKGT